MGGRYNLYFGLVLKELMCWRTTRLDRKESKLRVYFRFNWKHIGKH